MKRRTFLTATLATVGLSFLGISCSDDEDSDAQEILKDGTAFFPQSIASGDPKPESVILWTRIQDPDRQGPLELALQLASDPDFKERISLEGQSELSLTADPAFDHCVKVKVSGLQPYQVYYYRFVYRKDDEAYASRTGRTKTAPAPDQDVAVRFAYASGQDYNGHFYNAYRHMAAQDLDFFIHLGDYVYETTGDPSFQNTQGRRLQFQHPEEAIVFNQGTEDEYFAAKSLDNYRDLYRTYRSDKDLQAAHEHFPIIAIWDDHEYSDDCHGPTATYFDGRKDEYDLERLKNAHQAWFEYMPVDYPDNPEFQYDRSKDFPNDIRIYRDFRFGKHLHLAMTDLRTYRADHLIPENAFPGALAMTQQDLVDFLGTLPESARPYVNIDTFDQGSYAEVIKEHAELLDIDPHAVKGNIAVDYINATVSFLNENLDLAQDIALINPEEYPELEKGIAFIHFGKTKQYHSIGSRYLVIAPTFELYARWKYQQTQGESETCMGTEQEQWFLNSMKQATTTWKIWGNEYCLSPLRIDLEGLPNIPEALAQKFYLNADDWSGMPNRRDLLIEALAKIDNALAITGDIHAFFAGTPMSASNPDQRIVEFVVSSISSETYQQMLKKQALSSPELANSGAVALAVGIESFLLDKTHKPNPHMGYASTARHGYISVTVDGSAFDVLYFEIDGSKSDEDLGDITNIEAVSRTTHFKVNVGERELYREFEGSWKKWDPNTLEWIS